jgi:alkylglycerol monooxygenase
MGHVEWIWKCVTGAESLADKLKHIFYGPGWMPGKPRMGDMEDIPDVKYPQPRFDARPEAPVLSFYCLIQFAVAFSLITFMQVGH